MAFRRRHVSVPMYEHSNVEVLFVPQGENKHWSAAHRDDNFYFKLLPCTGTPEIKIKEYWHETTKPY